MLSLLTCLHNKRLTLLFLNCENYIGYAGILAGLNALNAVIIDRSWIRDFELELSDKITEQIDP